jgi:myo-inositol-1-phosphate synthase
MRKPEKIVNARGKLAVLTPGMGAVATTFIAGVIAMRKGLGETHWVSHPDGNDTVGETH